MDFKIGDKVCAKHRDGTYKAAVIIKDTGWFIYKYFVRFTNGKEAGDKIWTNDVKQGGGC